MANPGFVGSCRHISFFFVTYFKIFHCSWLDTGEADGQTERTLYPAEGPIPEDQNQNAEVIVPLISPKPSPEPTPREEEEAEAVEKSPSPEPQGRLI